MEDNIKINSNKARSLKSSAVEELLHLCTNKDKTDCLNKLELWQKKYQKELPALFTERIDPLTPEEWFCIGWAAYQTLLGKRFSSNREHLITTLLEGNLCSLMQLGKIFGAENQLFRCSILTEEKEGIRLNPDYFNALFGFSLRPSLGLARETSPDDKQETEEKEKFTVPLDLAERVKQYVVGQEQAVDALCAAVYEHYMRVQAGENGSKTNVLLLGPTGTGKTFLCHTVAKLLKAPFLDVNITQYSQTGYVGDSISDILRSLQTKISDMHGNVFPFSIVYIDEIDKLRCFSQDAADVRGRGVQEELLKLLEGAEYTCAEGRFSPRKRYDISRVLFIAGGAFVGVDKIIAKRTRAGGIGFAAGKTKAVASDIQARDLEEYGLLPELVGRFGMRSSLKPLSEEDLTAILSGGKDNVLAQYKRIFAKAGIRLTVPKSTLTKIARQGLSCQTGARGLKNVLSGVLGPALLSAKKSGKTRVVLTPQMLEEK